MDEDTDAWVGLATVADRLGPSPASVERLVAQGLLGGRRTVDGFVFHEADLETFRAKRVARQRERFEDLRALEDELDRL